MDRDFWHLTIKLLFTFVYSLFFTHCCSKYGATNINVQQVFQKLCRVYRILRSRLTVHNVDIYIHTYTCISQSVVHHHTCRSGIRKKPPRTRLWMERHILGCEYLISEWKELFHASHILLVRDPPLIVTSWTFHGSGGNIGEILRIFLGGMIPSGPVGRWIRRYVPET